MSSGMFLQELKHLQRTVCENHPECANEDEVVAYAIKPFISFLGYDTNSPKVVKKQYKIKTGEKNAYVDLAVMLHGSPVMIVEAKYGEKRLNGKERDQLSRYFPFTDAEIGILTDGIEFRFYTNLDKASTMDSEPFYVFDMCKRANERDASILERFTSESFCVADLKKSAFELLTMSRIRDTIQGHRLSPPDWYVRGIAGELGMKGLRQSGRDDLASMIVDVYHQIADEDFDLRIEPALRKGMYPKTSDSTASPDSKEFEIQDSQDADVEQVDPVEIPMADGALPIFYTIGKANDPDRRTENALYIFKDGKHLVEFDGQVGSVSGMAKIAKGNGHAPNGWTQAWEFHCPLEGKIRKLDCMRDEETRNAVFAAM